MLKMMLYDELNYPKAKELEIVMNYDNCQFL